MAYGDIDRYEVENIVNDAVRRAKREIEEHAAEDKRMLQGQIADLQDDVQRLQHEVSEQAAALARHRTDYDDEKGIGHLA